MSITPKQPAAGSGLAEWADYHQARAVACRAAGHFDEARDEQQLADRYTVWKRLGYGDDALPTPGEDE